MSICNALILTPDIEVVFVLLLARTHTRSPIKKNVKTLHFTNVMGVETSLENEHYKTLYFKDDKISLL